MKYKLINITTKEETLCDKVTIDGFNYYVIDSAIGCKYGISRFNIVLPIQIGYDATLYKGIICTNNPNIDIPQVVDKIEELVRFSYEATKNQKFANGIREETVAQIYFRKGYNKAKETYFFSYEDTKSFAAHFHSRRLQGIEETIDSSFQLWKEQQPKIVYYE